MLRPLPKTDLTRIALLSTRLPLSYELLIFLVECLIYKLAVMSKASPACMSVKSSLCPQESKFIHVKFH